MTVELTFVDELPYGGGRPKKYSEHVVALRARPGKWAIIDAETKPPSTASLRQSYGTDYEFATRDHRKVDGRNVCTLYARMIASETKKPVAPTPTFGDKVLMCDDCEFECGPADASAMTRHARQAHQRRISTTERTPIARSAA